MKNTPKYIVLFFFSFIFYHSYSQSLRNCGSSSFPDSNVIFIQSGSFYIGDKRGDVDEKPRKKIHLKSFYIGKFEVTNKEFTEFLNAKGNQIENHSPWIDLNGTWNNLKCRIFEKDSLFIVEPGYENFPVNFVSWFGAYAFCKWKGGRLPSEAEWEYLAKGGNKSKEKNLLNIEANLDKYAWYFMNSGYEVKERGRLEPNILGVYDLHGNLWEWCDDFYDATYYKRIAMHNPTGPEKGDFKVIRGGSWTNKSEMLRISNRNALSPNSNKINIGFRIVFDE